jgi:long-chain acyl-CoA synthetase
MNEQALGEVGEIVVRSPGAMLGYWNLPELTRQTLVDGWVRTGDAGYMDEEGFVYLVDRLKDMIVSGGENVFSAEVENALAAHEHVAECAVIGVPDERWGERVHAIVRPRGDAVLTPEDIIAHCRTLIAGYKCPRSVDFRSEPLPLSGAGKILKTELRKPYWPQDGRRIN